MGYVAKSSYGQTVMIRAGKLDGVHDALCAETSARLEALMACSEQGMISLQVETDCANLV